MTRGRLGMWVVAAGLSLAAPAHAANAPGSSDLEYSVKANYLVRFAAFVGWPPRAFGGAEAPVVICVAGHDPFKGSLDRAARAQTAYGRPLAVRRPTRPEAIEGCHIVYVGQGGGALIPTQGPRPVLTVTDSAVGSNRGMVHFVVSDARVRFHIDLQSASRSGLSVSSRLLNLALSVRGG